MGMRRSFGERRRYFGIYGSPTLISAAVFTLIAGQSSAFAACPAGSIAVEASNGRCVLAVEIGDDTGEIPQDPKEGGGDGGQEGGPGRTDILSNLAGLGQTFATAGVLASAITQDVIAAALDGKIEPAVSPVMVTVSGFPSSPYMISGYKTLSHDGFSINSAILPNSVKTPGFDEENYGLTIGTRFDGSNIFDTAPGSVTLGVLGNYTHTEIDIDAPVGFPQFSKGGSAEINSWSVGGFGLVTDGRRYGLLSVTGTFGSPETSSNVVPASASFNNFGLATSAMAGVLVPVSGDTRLDLRGGLNYIYARSDDYVDSANIAYTDGHMEEFSGSVSARLFTMVRGTDYNLRPFVQGGLTQRFHYQNELTIGGTDFSFDDADTSAFARAGVDFEVGQSTQAYVAVRGDASEDYEAISAQVGLTFKLD